MLSKLIIILMLGAEHFNQKITDRIKSYEDACDESTGPLPYPCPKNDRQEAVNAFYMLDVIAKKLLDGVVLDWANDNQSKWYPVFDRYSSGAGFQFFDSLYVWTYTSASGGARLCLDTKEKSDYFGTQFLGIWNKYLKPHK